MSNFVISTDSTCDLPEAYIKEHGLMIQTLFYAMNDVIYGDEIKMGDKEFYDTMRTGAMPTTMASNPESVTEHFRAAAKEGSDILHISFSSGLSSSHNSAVLAAEAVREEYPNVTIQVVDSLCASLGQGLLVHKAVGLRDAGASLEETVQWLEKNKLHLCHQFTVDDLYHLHRGGRVSKTVAVLGTLINVKPVLHVDDEGHLTSLCNVRGRKKALTTLVDHMAEQIPGYDNDIVFISHSDCLADAEFVGALIKERFGIDSILYSYISPTIGAHTGPGTVALFFMGEKR